MNTKGKRAIVILVIGFLVLLAPALVMAQSLLTIRVNCDRGQSVQSALNLLFVPATIVVTGTCHENIEIKKDDVTIKGGTFVGPDPNQNTIQVHAARRVLITGATVTGANHGVRAYQGASLTLENSLIEGNARYGVVSTHGSSVNINVCTIRQNTLFGVYVTDNSALNLTNSTITGNGGTGVIATRSSSARIGQGPTGVSGPNTITGNSGEGVSITRSAYAMIDGNTIKGNSGIGIHIEGASAIVTNNTIANNQLKGIVVHNSGNARIGITESNSPGPNTIENNVDEGIQIIHGASVYLLANTIKSNGLTNHRGGVRISRATGNIIGDNIIQGNGGHGVAVNQGTLFFGIGDWNITPAPGPNIITQNGYSGIFGWNGASLDIRHSTVTDNAQNGIVLSLQSTLRIYDATVSGNTLTGIVLYDGSSVARYSGDIPRDSITGNLGGGIICNGGSNLIGNTSGVSGNSVVQVDCPPIFIP
jgi:parallel beta-helix repeat protein